MAATTASEQKARCPVYRPGGSRHDLSQYSGRLLHFLDVIDPCMLFVTEAQLVAARAKLAAAAAAAHRHGMQHQHGDGPAYNAELWHAKKVVDSVVHPDTGEKIFLPLRMSAFVPVGVIFVLGMLRPQASLRSAIFWQWANQSSNALINYANRNATADDKAGSKVFRTMAESYTVAVSGACAITFGATRLLDNVVAAQQRHLQASARGNVMPLRILLARSARCAAAARLFVPLVSVCTANSFSLCVIRRRELHLGIAVEDEAGGRVGTSRAAARKAIGEMVLSRGVFLPASVLGIQPLAMAAVDALLKPRPELRLGINAVTAIGALGAMLPLALACFPQRGSIAIHKLEPELQAKLKGSATTVLWYNKGL
jgi:tricarboxylate carrier